MRKLLISLMSAVLMIMLCAPWGGAADKSEPRVKIDLSGHPIKGPANAAVTIVVFSDYL